MDRVTSFEYISGNFPSKFKTESSENDEPKSIECIADNIEFKCVWKKKEVNMQLVNQFMNQVNIYDDNEYGDQTPSNILALLSSSFPSGTASEKDMQVDVDNENDYGSFLFVSSTPKKDLSQIDCSSAKQRNDALAFEEFNKASPIYSPMKRNKNILTRKRLQYSYEFEDFGFEKKLKMLNI